MTTYNWTITNLYTKTVDGLQDYVVNAMYNVTGVDGEFSASIDNFSIFTVKEGSEFIPYSELTQDIVLDWIKEGLGENGLISITTNIDGQIESQKNPPITPQNTPLPWI